MHSRIARHVGAFLLLLSCLAAGIAQAAPPKRWTFVELGSFGGESRPGDVNNRGDVVGSAWVPSALRHHAFLWQNGVMFDVGASFADHSTLVRITDRGTMLGYVNQVPHLWIDGVVTSLPMDFALDVNRFEHVVGWQRIFVGGFQQFGARAALYRDGVVHDLGTLGGQQSMAKGINDRGVVVGSSFIAMDSRVSHAFAYEDGVMRDLGTLGGAESFAHAVNNHGVIIGTAQEPSGRFVAVAWDRAGIRRLVDAASNTIDINDRGQILITANTPDGGFGAFLYEDGILTRLDTLPEVKAQGIAQISVSAINDRGWIVGSATRTLFDPKFTAFALIPR